MSSALLRAGLLRAGLLAAGLLTAGLLAAGLLRAALLRTGLLQCRPSLRTAWRTSLRQASTLHSTATLRAMLL